MQTVPQLLDAIKKKHGITSDYKLALFTGIREQSIGNYRHGRTLPDAGACAKLAVAAGMDADVLSVQIEAQREKTEDARQLWSRVAQRLQMGSANVEILALIAIFLLASFAQPVQHAIESAIGGFGQSVYYVKWIVAIRFAWRIARLFKSVILCNAGLNVPRNQHSGLLIAA